MADLSFAVVVPIYLFPYWSVLVAVMVVMIVVWMFKLIVSLALGG